MRHSSYARNWIAALLAMAVRSFAVDGNVPLADPAARIVGRYRQMLETNPVEGTAMERLWKFYQEKNQAHALIAEYEKKADTFAGAMVLGHLLARSGSPEEAARLYTRAAELSPGSSLPLLSLGAVQRGAGKHKEAADAFERAAALLTADDPRLGETLLESGSEWFAANEGERASAVWEKAMQQDPGNGALRRRLAESYQSFGASDRAIFHFQEIARSGDPTSRAQALQQIARIEQARGRTDAAVEALERALAASAPGAWLRGELQSQLIRLSQRAQRVPALEARWLAYAEAQPRDLTGPLQLVDLYERTGELQKQRAWLEKVIAMAPAPLEHRIRLARLLARMDELPAAARAYDELLKVRSRDADLTFERARIDVRMNQAKSAHARVEGLLADRKSEVELETRALEFYETNRMVVEAEDLYRTRARRNPGEGTLALVTFLFTQKRSVEALAELDAMYQRGSDAKERAALAYKAAQFLKSQGAIDAALERASWALKDQPDMRPCHVLIGESHLLENRPEAAAKAFEKAYELSTTEAERLEADQKLFESLRQVVPAGEVVQTRGRGNRDGFTSTSQAAQTYLLQLTRRAVDEGSEDAWMRVARWQLWNRNPQAARDAAKRVLTLNGKSRAAHEFLAQLYSEDARSGDPTEHLAALQELDPANRAVYERRAASALMAAGRTDLAMEMYEAMAERYPGEITVLTDLAVSHQRLSDWEAALKAWQRIYALGPGPRRKEAASAMHRLMERLLMNQDAAELLLREMDAASELRDRFSGFADLLGHCARNEMLPWLKTELEARLKLRADDYFTEVAYGRTLRAIGENAAAFEVLARAVFSAPEPAEALPELIREAETLRRPRDAIRLQDFLIRVSPEPAYGDFVRLAELQESVLDLQTAAATWERALARFPRSADALQSGADFFLRTGLSDRALPYLRRLHEIESSHARALYALGLMEERNGNVEASLECFETLLKDTRSPVERGGRLTQYVQTEDLERDLDNREASTPLLLSLGQEAEGVAAPTRAGLSEGSLANLRLEAIRRVARARLKKGGAELETWIAQWRDADVPSEALYALLLAGEKELLLKYMETRMGVEEERIAAVHAFVCVALHSRLFERLRAWLDDPLRSNQDLEVFDSVLSRYVLGFHGAFGAEEVDRLLPTAARSRRWQIAEWLALRGDVRSAVTVGRELLASSTDAMRAGYGVRVGEWLILIGDLAGARKVFMDSVDGPGETLLDPAYTALRQLILLTREDERAPLIAQLTADATQRGRPLHTALTRLTVYAASGEEAKARQEMRRVLELGALSGNSDVGELRGADEQWRDASSRRFNFLVACSEALRRWNADRLAIAFLDGALEDRALLSLHSMAVSTLRRRNQADPDEIGGSRWQRLRAILAALRMSNAEPATAQRISVDYLRGAGRDSEEMLAEELSRLGAWPACTIARKTLWENDPGSGPALNEYLESARKAGDMESMEEALERSIKGEWFAHHLVAQRDLSLRWADLLLDRGAVKEALELAKNLAATNPAEWRTLQRLAQTFERCGDIPGAEAALRRALLVDVSNGEARLGLAIFAEKRGDIAGAIQILEQGNGVVVDTKLAQLYMSLGRTDDALMVLARIPTQDQLTPALLLSDLLAAQKKRETAAALIRLTAARMISPKMAVPLLSRLMTILEPGDSRALLNDFKAVKAACDGDPATLGGYYSLFAREAVRLKLEREMLLEFERDWADGAGSLEAGVALLNWQISNGSSKVSATLDQVLKRPDVRESHLLQIAETAEGIGTAGVDTAILALSAITRLFPAGTDVVHRLARLAAANGRKALAISTLESLAARAALDPAISAQVAKTLASIQEPMRAIGWYRRAVSADPAIRAPKVFVELAQLLIAQRDFGSSKKILELAFRNPSISDVELIIQWAEAAGRMNSLHTDLASFPLSGRRLERILRVLFLRYESEAQIDPFYAMAESYPKLWSGVDRTKVRIFAEKTGTEERAIGVLERMAEEDTAGDPGLKTELATLLQGVANRMAASGLREAALTRIERAAVLNPEHFSVIRTWALLLLESGRREDAARALEAFATATRDAETMQAAQEWLRRIQLGEPGTASPPPEPSK